MGKETITMTQPELHEKMRQTFEECLEISKAKNHDYTQGGENALKNFELVEYLGITDTTTGIAVRLADKFSRLATLLTREAKVTDEKIDGTIKDAINYLALLRASLEDN